jgi:hypothetical protein
MTSIEELRKHRIELDTIYFFNNESRGIALFDLILSFVGAYILDILFNISRFFCNQEVYYLSVIPFGILVHHIIAHINGWSKGLYLVPEEFTFLNKKLFSLELNVYKVLILLLLYLIYVRC